MADKEEKSNAEMTPAERSEALAEAAQEAERLQMDEAGPDHYFIVNGKKVDANGEPIAEKK